MGKGVWSVPTFRFEKLACIYQRVGLYVLGMTWTHPSHSKWLQTFRRLECKAFWIAYNYYGFLSIKYSSVASWIKDLSRNTVSYPKRLRIQVWRHLESLHRVYRLHCHAYYYYYYYYIHTNTDATMKKKKERKENW